MVKFVSVNEDFVSTKVLLDKQDEPSVAMKETLERLVAHCVKLNSKLM